MIELERPVYDQYDVPELFTDVRTAQPKRYVVDVERGELVDAATFDYRLMCDFPAVDPRLWEREYRDFWVLGISATREPGRKFFDQVVHCDWQTGEPAIYQVAPRRYLGGEPVFLPDLASERRGAVICQELDAETLKMRFLIFDAFDVARGPVAALGLRSPIHLGFHTSYQPAEWS